MDVCFQLYHCSESSGNCSSVGWFHLWKVFALEPSEISLAANMLFCHLSHKQPHTVPTSHSERLFVSFLPIPVILLSFKSAALLAGSKDPNPVIRCYQAPTLRPPDQTSSFSQKLPISQVYAHSFTLHNPIETASYYSAKKEKKVVSLSPRFSIGVNLIYVKITTFECSEREAG